MGVPLGMPAVPALPAILLVLELLGAHRAVLIPIPKTACARLAPAATLRTLYVSFLVYLWLNLTLLCRALLHALPNARLAAT